LPAITELESRTVLFSAHNRKITQVGRCVLAPTVSGYDTTNY